MTEQRDVEVLHGGVANAGAVLRVGEEVRRPLNAHSTRIRRFLTELREQGATCVPEPLGHGDHAVDEHGRERLRFEPGAVATVPFPDWVQSDAALVSATELLARFHDASARVDPGGAWSDELADPLGGPIVCHNDVCWENVVFRDGEAVVLLDWDYAAPGRPVHDLAAFVRMCVPVDDEGSARRLGWHNADRAARVRLAAEVYGLDAHGRAELLSCLDRSMEHGGEFVRRHVEAGHPGFVQMWSEMGGAQRYERRHRWWRERRSAFAAALD